MAVACKRKGGSCPATAVSMALFVLPAPGCKREHLFSGLSIVPDHAIHALANRGLSPGVGALTGGGDDDGFRPERCLTTRADRLPPDVSLI